jgi:hypothetical protein
MDAVRSPSLKWEMMTDMFQLQVMLVLKELMHSLSCLHNDPYIMPCRIILEKQNESHAFKF